MSEQQKTVLMQDSNGSMFEIPENEAQKYLLPPEKQGQALNKFKDSEDTDDVAGQGMPGDDCELTTFVGSDRKGKGRISRV